MLGEGNPIQGMISPVSGHLGPRPGMARPIWG
jgi:hypothetical protein